MALPNVAKDKGKTLVFEVLHQLDSLGPRLGKLIVPERKELETPNFFAITSRGVIPHMTPDVIAAHSQLGGVHMALEDFIERAMKGTPPVLNCPSPSPLHTFTSLPKSLISLFAPRRTPAVSAPNGNTNTAISIFTSTGFQVLQNKAYITYLTSLSPDISVSLADVAHNTVPGQKRMLKMGDRTEAWLSQLLASKNEGQAVFAPVLPISYAEQFEYLNHIADELADDVSGLAFYDADLLVDVPATTWLGKLPRLSLDEPRSPGMLLRQVGMGMDLFTVPFVGFATDAGIALSFTFPKPLPEPAQDEEKLSEDATNETGNGTSLLPLGIDMWTPQHATSLLPLSSNCTCYACTSHHRAFIQHLLSAKEMLGWVLLQIHNHHVLSTFFAAVRESIGRGTFEEDCTVFEKTYESELPEKSGQGPRVRGYHYKSEGKGEGKRNKNAWAADLGIGGDGERADEEIQPDVPAEILEKNSLAEELETKI